MKIKMFWSIIISLAIFAPGIVVWAFFDEKKLPFLSFLILELTLIVLIWYAYDTNRIANQTIEANLRPVVLRSGYISWDSIKFTRNENNGTVDGQPIQFTILKNIAKDVSGFIVIDNRKYALLFGNSISQVANQPLVKFEKNWGWLSPGSVLFAIFDPTQWEQANQDNEIYVRYKDIEGNEYFTREDKFFSSISGNL